MAPARVIIPVRGAPEAKTRLSNVLLRFERERLVERLFRRVLQVTVAVVPARQCFVLSGERRYLEIAEQSGAQALLDDGRGLNLALEISSEQLAQLSTDPVLVLFADLPWLAPADIGSMLGTSADVAIARDYLGSGTNALWMRRPGLLPYRFGTGSFTAHAAECGKRQLTVAILDEPGLARDLDDPDTLSDYLRDFGQDALGA